METSITRIDDWLAMFPFELPSNLELLHAVVPDNISSPYELAILEQIRRLVGRDENLGPSIPADVFLFALGEPQRRDATKVGGLPYRPADLPWPMRPDGDPYTFVAQFNFLQSRDLVGRLPGEMLLVFHGDHEAPCDDFQFEWYPPGILDLIEPADVPPAGWKFVTCYGVRCRTHDFPYGSRACERRLKYVSSLDILPATKIGGLPDTFLSEPFRWLMPDPQGREWTDAEMVWPIPDWPKPIDGKHGRFLCSLASICPKGGVPYPWVNRPQPISPLTDSRDDTQSLIWYDMGTAYFYLAPDGEMFWDSCG